jgi:translation initiation factor 3 subunit C
MASRFFAASDSSSDESSEEELYSNDEESEQENSDKDSDDDSDDDDDDSSDSGSETGANRFLKDASSDSESDDEDVNKVLKSAKDKRFDELEATIRLIENAQKINDWAVISERTFIPAMALEAAQTTVAGYMHDTDNVVIQNSTSSSARCLL